MPVRLSEAALALEDVIPRLVNATRGPGACRAVVAITDKFESSAFEQAYVESVPAAGEPIVSADGQFTNEAFLDWWLAKGTLLGEDGTYSVFVVFIDVMRRPLQGSWTVQNITVLGSRQSISSLLEEIELDRAYA